MTKHSDWQDATGRLSTIDLELMADTLKERIYATLAILAVLMTIDPNHTSPGKAALITGGTALSLWLASIVSSRMAKRMVFGRQGAEEVIKDRQRHAPLLASSALPLILIGMSAIHAFSLEMAVNMSIGAILLTLILWSLASARTMHASRFASVILAAILLMIGLGVVALKALVSH